MKNALIIVDPQNDFISGSLKVNDAENIIPLLNKLIECNEFDIICLTQDWHPNNHKSFITEHIDKNVFDNIDLDGVQQTIWPVHCVQNTIGAEFHIDLNIKKDNIFIFKKGMNVNVDSHSGFFDNKHNESTGLSEFLKSENVKNIFVCGLATDVCVEYTALDGVNEGFNTTVIIDACRGISEDLTHCYNKLLQKNVKLVEYMNLIV